MMRRPTSPAAALAWWRRATDGLPVQISPGYPECGWFKRRLVKGGPFVPVRIYMVREIDPATGELTAPERIEADMNGTSCDPQDIWTHLTPISRAEYEAMIFNPVAPLMHDPRQPLDLTKEPLAWTR